MFTVTETYEDEFDAFHAQLAEGIEDQRTAGNEPDESWEAYSLRMMMEELEEEEGDEFTDFPLELLN